MNWYIFLRVREVKRPVGGGFCHVLGYVDVRLSVIWHRNQIREIGPRIGYHFPGN